MNNIYEMIGIFKGISFDGIINEKEVERLQNWVDKNRNFICESKQVELVRLVDKVLEDNIINDDEREIVLLYLEEFIEKNLKGTIKNYELNGIIEGIVCDGKVNKKEVCRLQSWIDNYGELVLGQKSSGNLCDALKIILEDGIVTEEEQDQILEMLSERITDSQFETKLVYLQKSVKLKKNIGVDLIDLLDNEDAMNKIHRRAESQLKKVLNSYTGSYVNNIETIFISLVLIAMLKYDGNYYANVEKTYLELYQKYPEQKIEGLIRSIINRYKIDEESSKSSSRIINTVLANAIVPSHFLPAFFEFIYDIYKINFEYELSDVLYDDFLFVYEGLHSSMISEGDDLKLNVTKKTYKLIKSTKWLISNEKHLDPVIKLSMIIVKLIDKKFWNKELKIYNIYLKNGCEGWIKTLKDEENLCVRTKMDSEIRSRWGIKYVRINNEIYLVPPVHKVKAKYNYSDIKIVVYNHENKIYFESEPDIREIIGGYQVSVDKIKLEDPLGTVTYKLLAGEEIIFESKEKLYRKFIVFDTSGNEIKNNYDFQGTAVFCYKNEEKEIKSFYNTSTYMLGSKSVKTGEAYMIEGCIFNFSSLIRPGIIGEKYENHYLVSVESEEKIYVYKKVEILLFETDKVVAATYEITINGKIHRLDDYGYTITEREGSNKYIVEIKIDQVGIYIIAVHQILKSKRKKIFSINFALDPRLEVEDIKIDDEWYMVSVKTDLCSMTINTEINVHDFSEDCIKIENRGKKYKYYIPFHFDIYRIAGKSWLPLNQMMWIGDINQESFLDIYGTNINEMRIYASTGEILNEVIELKNNEVYQQVSIGFLISYKVTYDYVLLVFMKDGIRKKEIFCYNKCILNESETELIFDPVTKILDVIPYYEGKGNVFFKIHDFEKKEVFRSKYLENEVSVQIKGLKSFEKYCICFYEKESVFSIKKIRLMKQYKKVFYAWNDMIGNSFRINKVYFDKVICGKFMRKSQYLNKSYLMFESKKNDDIYIGKLYKKTLNGDLELDKVNPVSIEICSEVIDERMELSITKDGDGIFLDFENHGIKNILDDDLATDIFSYKIEMSGVEKNE